MTDDSLFVTSRVAEGYAESRPRFHGNVLSRLALKSPDFSCFRALDVGCGTGLSTLPLRDFASQVIGIDRSAAMLAAAEHAPGVRYVAASGEGLPFVDGAFDLLSVAGAINWIDRKLFFAESWRVLRAGALLWVYDGAEQGAMIEEPSYRAWYVNQYLSRFPRPPRDERPITDEEAANYGFELLAGDSYQLEIPLSASAWVAFLMTQSNVTHALEQTQMTADATKRWFHDSLGRYFGGREGSAGRERRLLFGGPIWCLQRRIDGGE